MPIKIIQHKMTYMQIDRISEAGLEPILRQAGMDVVFIPGRGVVSAPGSKFTWRDSHCDRTFTWEGMVPETSEEQQDRIAEHAAKQFLNSLSLEKEFNYEAEKSKIDDLFARRPISLED